MALRFNRLVRPGRIDTTDRFVAASVVDSRSTRDKMIFMSHKTGDRQAEVEATYIAETHQVQVYMAEWDDDVEGDSNELPSHIMDAIGQCDGFLVHVIQQIATSMWIGYEIGGAHAMNKTRAKIMYRTIYRLPSVVGALRSLSSRGELDSWIIQRKG